MPSSNKPLEPVSTSWRDPRRGWRSAYTRAMCPPSELPSRVNSLGRASSFSTKPATYSTSPGTVAWLSGISYTGSTGIMHAESPRLNSGHHVLPIAERAEQPVQQQQHRPLAFVHITRIAVLLVAAQFHRFLCYKRLAIR